LVLSAAVSVWVESIQSTAEATPEQAPGKFRFHAAACSGTGVPASVTVTFQLSGTASSGGQCGGSGDYTGDLLSGTVDVPVNGSADVTFDAVDDQEVEGEETVVVTLDDGGEAYSVPPEGFTGRAAAAGIADNDVDLLSMTVQDIDDWSAAVTVESGSEDLYVLEKAGGSATIALSGVTNPDSPDAHLRALWKIDGSGTSATSGNFLDDGSITLTPGDREYTIRAGADKNDDGSLSDNEVTQTVNVTVVRVELAEDVEVFLNSYWYAVPTVTPSSAASHVKLKIGDIDIATFADGSDVTTLTASEQPVEVYGANYISGTDGLEGEATLSVAVINDHSTSASAAAATTAFASGALSAAGAEDGDNFVQSVGKVIGDLFSKAAKAAYDYMSNTEARTADGIKSAAHTAFTDDMARLRASNDPVDWSRADQFQQWWDTGGREQVDQASTKAASQIVSGILGSDPSDYEQTRFTLDTTPLAGAVKGYKPTVALLHDEDFLLGVSIKPQPINDMLQHLATQPNDVWTNPEWFVREISLGAGITFDPDHKFQITGGLVYDQDAPKLSNPDFFTSFEYRAQDLLPGGGMRTISVGGQVRTRFNDDDPSKTVFMINLQMAQ
jgi:hypothetical protein